jgi:phage tail-like protein
MARVSSSDPLDRFRFRVIVIEDILASQGFGNVTGNTVKQIGGGFSEITLPKADTTTISYRENIHPTRFIKKPGLTRYDPIVLRRGVVLDRSIYEWYKLINNDAIGFSVTAEIVGSALAIPPVYPIHFRKDLMISCLDREGNAVKSWVLLEAFPVSFKAGNDLDAQANEKLITELGLSFEAMVEIEGSNITSLTDEADAAAYAASIAAAVGFVVNGGG